MEWREAELTRAHDRLSFDCGEPELNEYLRRYARQNNETGGAKTFVAVPPDEPTHILGYYSVTPTSLENERVPRSLTSRLGRYPFPGFRLARLAVDRPAQGQGLGYELLLAAGERAIAAASIAGGVALVIDAENERAAAWYEAHGASRLPDDSRTLILPFAVLRAALDT